MKKREELEDKFVNAQLFRRVERKGCCKNTQKYTTIVENNMKAKMQCQYICSHAPGDTI